MQLAIEFATRRARRTDPETSHAAAAKAQEFAESHAGRIHLALIRAGNATGKELAAATGYSMEQVCRRLPDLHTLGLARVSMKDGKTLVRGGARVWEATGNA